ncbi:MAG: glycosyltransferase [Porticoccaceae bacterium]|nr:glycosyltransferase [Porticoccaceae bacterium]
MPRWRNKDFIKWLLLVSSGTVIRVWRAQLSEIIWKITKRINCKLPIRGDYTVPSFVFLYYPNAIAGSQLYPFYSYRKKIRRQYGLTLKALPLNSLEKVGADGGATNVQVVAVQAHFKAEDKDLGNIFSLIKSNFPKAKVVFFDWYAPSDLRLFSKIDPYIDKYVKKTLFVDSHEYRKSHFGDTNLMDYYGKLYNCQHENKKYVIPKSIDKKLIEGVGFLTAPYLYSLFSNKGVPVGSRPIDLNARFTVKGSDWYSQMRAEALKRTFQLSSIYSVSNGPLPKIDYLIELGRSKMTFSPFGYGEICWRDYEAVALGSLLLKPDMGNLKTYPDIFIPYETYVPVAWDFSDFAEKFTYYIANPDERLRITKNAYQVGHQFFKDEEFFEHLKQII